MESTKERSNFLLPRPQSLLRRHSSHGTPLKVCLAVYSVYFLRLTDGLVY